MNEFEQSVYMLICYSDVLSINFSPFGIKSFIPLGSGSNRKNANRSPLGVSPLFLMISSMIKETLDVMSPMNNTMKIPIVSVIFATL